MFIQINFLYFPLQHCEKRGDSDLICTKSGGESQESWEIFVRALMLFSSVLFDFADALVIRSRRRLVAGTAERLQIG